MDHQIPRPRKPHNDSKTVKTLVVVRGNPNIGKTSLCSNLINNQVGYLSLDSITDNPEWHKIKELHEFRSTLEFPSHMIDQVNEFINKTCSHKFVKSIFKHFINPMKEDYILVDGHFLSLKNNYHEFVERSQKYSYRLWVMDRVLPLPSTN